MSASSNVHLHIADLNAFDKMTHRIDVVYKQIRGGVYTLETLCNSLDAIQTCSQRLGDVESEVVNSRLRGVDKEKYKAHKDDMPVQVETAATIARVACRLLVDVRTLIASVHAPASALLRAHSSAVKPLAKRLLLLHAQSAAQVEQAVRAAWEERRVCAQRLLDAVAALRLELTRARRQARRRRQQGTEDGVGTDNCSPTHSPRSLQSAEATARARGMDTGTACAEANDVAVESVGPISVNPAQHAVDAVRPASLPRVLLPDAGAAAPSPAPTLPLPMAAAGAQLWRLLARAPRIERTPLALALHALRRHPPTATVEVDAAPGPSSLAVSPEEAAALAAARPLFRALASALSHYAHTVQRAREMQRLHWEGSAVAVARWLQALEEARVTALRRCRQSLTGGLLALQRRVREMLIELDECGERERAEADAAGEGGAAESGCSCVLREGCEAPTPAWPAAAGAAAGAARVYLPPQLCALAVARGDARGRGGSASVCALAQRWRVSHACTNRYSAEDAAVASAAAENTLGDALDTHPRNVAASPSGGRDSAGAAEADPTQSATGADADGATAGCMRSRRRRRWALFASWARALQLDADGDALSPALEDGMSSADEEDACVDDAPRACALSVPASGVAEAMRVCANEAPRRAASPCAAACRLRTAPLPRHPPVASATSPSAPPSPAIGLAVAAGPCDPSAPVHWGLPLRPQDASPRAAALQLGLLNEADAGHETDHDNPHAAPSTTPSTVRVALVRTARSHSACEATTVDAAVLARIHGRGVRLLRLGPAVKAVLRGLRRAFVSSTAASAPPVEGDAAELAAAQAFCSETSAIKATPTSVPTAARACVVWLWQRGQPVPVPIDTSAFTALAGARAGAALPATATGSIAQSGADARGFATPTTSSRAMPESGPLLTPAPETPTPGAPAPARAHALTSAYSLRRGQTRLRSLSDTVSPQPSSSRAHPASPHLDVAGPTSPAPASPPLARPRTAGCDASRTPVRADASPHVRARGSSACPSRVGELDGIEDSGTAPQRGYSFSGCSASSTSVRQVVGANAAVERGDGRSLSSSAQVGAEAHLDAGVRGVWSPDAAAMHLGSAAAAAISPLLGPAPTLSPTLSTRPLPHAMPAPAVLAAPSLGRTASTLSMAPAAPLVLPFSPPPLAFPAASAPSPPPYAHLHAHPHAYPPALAPALSVAPSYAPDVGFPLLPSASFLQPMHSRALSAAQTDASLPISQPFGSPVPLAGPACTSAEATSAANAAAAAAVAGVEACLAGLTAELQRKQSMHAPPSEGACTNAGASVIAGAPQADVVLQCSPSLSLPPVTAPFLASPTLPLAPLSAPPSHAALTHALARAPSSSAVAAGTPARPATPATVTIFASCSSSSSWAPAAQPPAQPPATAAAPPPLPPARPSTSSQPDTQLLAMRRASAATTTLSSAATSVPVLARSDAGSAYSHGRAAGQDGGQPDDSGVAMKAGTGYGVSGVRGAARRGSVPVAVADALGSCECEDCHPGQPASAAPHSPHTHTHTSFTHALRSVHARASPHAHAHTHARSHSSPRFGVPGGDGCDSDSECSVRDALEDTCVPLAMPHTRHSIARDTLAPRSTPHALLPTAATATTATNTLAPVARAGGDSSPAPAFLSRLGAAQLALAQRTSALASCPSPTACLGLAYSPRTRTHATESTSAELTVHKHAAPCDTVAATTLLAARQRMYATDRLLHAPVPVPAPPSPARGRVYASTADTGTMRSTAPAPTPAVPALPASLLADVSAASPGDDFAVLAARAMRPPPRTHPAADSKAPVLGGGAMRRRRKGLMGKGTRPRHPEAATGALGDDAPRASAPPSPQHPATDIGLASTVALAPVVAARGERCEDGLNASRKVDFDCCEAVSDSTVCARSTSDSRAVRAHAPDAGHTLPDPTPCADACACAPCCAPYPPPPYPPVHPYLYPFSTQYPYPHQHPYPYPYPYPPPYSYPYSYPHVHPHRHSLPASPHAHGDQHAHSCCPVFAPASDCVAALARIHTHAHTRAHALTQPCASDLACVERHTHHTHHTHLPPRSATPSAPSLLHLAHYQREHSCASSHAHSHANDNGSGGATGCSSAIASACAPGTQGCVPGAVFATRSHSHSGSVAGGARDNADTVVHHHQRQHQQAPACMSGAPGGADVSAAGLCVAATATHSPAASAAAPTVDEDLNQPAASIRRRRYHTTSLARPARKLRLPPRKARSLRTTALRRDRDRCAATTSDTATVSWAADAVTGCAAGATDAVDRAATSESSAPSLAATGRAHPPPSASVSGLGALPVVACAKPPSLPPLPAAALPPSPVPVLPQAPASAHLPLSPLQLGPPALAHARTTADASPPAALVPLLPQPQHAATQPAPLPAPSPLSAAKHALLASISASLCEPLHTLAPAPSLAPPALLSSPSFPPQHSSLAPQHTPYLAAHSLLPPLLAAPSWLAFPALPATATALPQPTVAASLCASLSSSSHSHSRSHSACAPLPAAYPSLSTHSSASLDPRARIDLDTVPPVAPALFPQQQHYPSSSAACLASPAAPVPPQPASSTSSTSALAAAAAVCSPPRFAPRSQVFHSPFLVSPAAPNTATNAAPAAHAHGADVSRSSSLLSPPTSSSPALPAPPNTPQPHAGATAYSPTLPAHAMPASPLSPPPVPLPITVDYYHTLARLPLVPLVRRRGSLLVRYDPLAAKGEGWAEVGTDTATDTGTDTEHEGGSDGDGDGDGDGGGDGAGAVCAWRVRVDTEGGAVAGVAAPASADGDARSDAPTEHCSRAGDAPVHPESAHTDTGSPEHTQARPHEPPVATAMTSVRQPSSPLVDPLVSNGAPCADFASPCVVESAGPRPLPAPAQPALASPTALPVPPSPPCTPPLPSSPASPPARRPRSASVPVADALTLTARVRAGDLQAPPPLQLASSPEQARAHAPATNADADTVRAQPSRACGPGKARRRARARTGLPCVVPRALTFTPQPLSPALAPVSPHLVTVVTHSEAVDEVSMADEDDTDVEDTYTDSCRSP